MLLLLSPAKSLDYDTPLGALGHARSSPLFAKQAQQLIDLLRDYSPAQLAQLMSLSDKLADLNVARYAVWSAKASLKNARQAVLAFNGDVYEGLNARSLSVDDLAWAQDHLCILSGLYGVLRPLDLMQAYRLEMGTRLANPQGKDLYQFWRAQIVNYLNVRLCADNHPCIVNLASQEYFKAVDAKMLSAPVVECVFQDCIKGQYKVVSFMAKRARGLMARFVVSHRLEQAEQLKAFNAEAYAWSPEHSTPRRLVFRRALV